MSRVEDGDLAQLRPDPMNAKRHTERGMAAVTTSVREVGVMRSLVAARDGTLIAGHATSEALADLDMTDAIFVHSDGTRPIVHIRDDVEPGSELAIKGGLYDNLTSDLSAGDYRPDILAALLRQVKVSPVVMTSHEAELLIQGKPRTEGIPDDEVPNDGAYSRAVEAPIYRVTGEEPAAHELVDEQRTNDLLRDIEDLDAPEAVRRFLRLAAYRHLRFDYAAIAEFYAHAEPEVQRLMERSALVIIDLDRAIEYGFVRLSKELRELAAEAEAVQDAG